MQARAIAARDERSLTNVELAEILRCAPGTIGHALNDTPARATPTLERIYNYLCVSTRPTTRDDVLDIARRAPESAALLAALFEEVAQLLRSASTVKRGKTRTRST
jgi:hypothetical protein